MFDDGFIILDNGGIGYLGFALVNGVPGWTGPAEAHPATYGPRIIDNLRGGFRTI